MTRPPRRSAARTTACLRSAAGVAGGIAMLLRPDAVAAAAAGDGTRPRAELIVVLGLRELTQGLVILRWPARPIATVGMAVDLLHGMSMLAARRLTPTFRTAATRSAVAAFAGATALLPAAMGGHG